MLGEASKMNNSCNQATLDSYSSSQCWKEEPDNTETLQKLKRNSSIEVYCTGIEYCLYCNSLTLSKSG